LTEKLPVLQTDDYITLDCDLAAKTAVEKGRLSLPSAPWSCMVMFNNNPVRMSTSTRMADGSNMTFGSWGSMTVNSHIINGGHGKFTVLNISKQRKKPVIQVGTIEKL